MSEEILTKENEAVTEEVSSDISKSKAKREARKAEVKAEKAKKSFDSILGWVIGIVVGLVVVGVIGLGIYTTAKDSANSAATADLNETPDFSLGLTDEGFVSKAKLDKVADLNLVNLEIALADVDFTEEDIDAQVESLLSTKKTYESDASLEVKDGDSINLDYSGSVDGVVFDGGTAAGQTLVIGSHSFIDTFEEQLIGAHPGDSVTVNVTFPEEYSKNPDLAGKPAVFECKINSIQVTPELTDAFVAENFSDQGSDIASLRASIKEEGIKNNTANYIATYISDNASATDVPKAYLANLEKVNRFNDYQNYQYMSQMYAMYGMATPTYEEYLGVSTEEYDAEIKTNSAAQASVTLTCEKIFKDNNLTIDEEVYNQLVGTNDTAVTTYGIGYVKQCALQQTVLNFLVDNAVIK